MKIITIVGARPQFIKAAAVSRAIAKHNDMVSNDRSKIQEMILHTGQHYDYNMSEVFFDELHIPKPDLNLGIGSGQHGHQTGKMLIEIEKVLLDQKPDWLLTYGDTNSTLAGALAAVKLHIPVAHVEAGLRSFNRIMPEEHNRVLTDHCSELLFCPTQTAVKNLIAEGVEKGTHWVGDVMYDSVLYNLKLAETESDVIDRLNLESKKFALATVHRAENTDDPNKLSSIFEALEEVSKNNIRVILPLHPRTLKLIQNLRGEIGHIQIIEPLPYLDMLMLELHAEMIFTDSGGVQKEAYWMKTPCITLREETEWVETIEDGWNVLVSSNKDKIIQSSKDIEPPAKQSSVFGQGAAAEDIVKIIGDHR